MPAATSVAAPVVVTIDERLDVLAPESVPLPPIRQALLEFRSAKPLISLKLRNEILSEFFTT